MGKELKGVKKLDKALTNMVNLYICEDIKCKFSTEFCIVDNKLFYSLFVEEEVDKDWVRWLKDTYGDRYDDDFSTFVLTFLHEVGHYFTLEDYDEEDYHKKVENFVIDYDTDTREEIVEKRRGYWDLEVEKAATDWAINFYNNHKEEMKNFYKDCMSFISVFYTQNLAY